MDSSLAVSITSILVFLRHRSVDEDFGPLRDTHPGDHGQDLEC